MKSSGTKSHVAAAFRAALPVSLPVLAGYLFLGSAYGVLMHKLGYGPGWTALMSVLVYGGTIQFIATSLLAAGYQPLYALFVSVLINARHLFYGFSMLERYSRAGWKKYFLIFWMTDETFSLLCGDDAPKGADADWFRFWVSGLNHCYWIVGGVTGNVAGSLFAFNPAGIDFVMTSLFTVIVINQWRSARTHIPAAIGFFASLASLILFGPEYFIIPAMFLITAALMSGRQRLEKATAAEDGEGCA